MRWGNQSTSGAFLVVGMVPIALLFIIGMPFVHSMLLFVGLFFIFMGWGWINYVVSHFRLSPLIDKAAPDETVWLRYTKDRIFIPQFVPKGPYGQTKGVNYRVKADVVDDGDFPVKTLNGNPALIVYDMMNTGANLNKSVARQRWKNKHGFKNGRQAYNYAKKNKKTQGDSTW